MEWGQPQTLIHQFPPSIYSLCQFHVCIIRSLKRCTRLCLPSNPEKQDIQRTKRRKDITKAHKCTAQICHSLHTGPLRASPPLIFITKFKSLKFSCFFSFTLKKLWSLLNSHLPSALTWILTLDKTEVFSGLDRYCQGENTRQLVWWTTPGICNYHINKKPAHRTPVEQNTPFLQTNGSPLCQLLNRIPHLSGLGESSNKLLKKESLHHWGNPWRIRELYNQSGLCWKQP